MSVLDELGTYLATAAVGTLGTDLFLGDMPEDPVELVSVFENPGQPPMDNFGEGTLPVAELPNIQVLCRSVDYQTARAKAKAAFVALVGVGNELLSSTRYYRVAALQSPFLIGRDGENRVLISCNYQVYKDVS